MFINYVEMKVLSSPRQHYMISNNPSLYLYLNCLLINYFRFKIRK